MQSTGNCPEYACQKRGKPLNQPELLEPKATPKRACVSTKYGLAEYGDVSTIPVELGYLGVGVFLFQPMSRLVDGDLNDRATNDDPPTFILIVVVGTALVHVSPAAVFFGLARR